MPICKNCGARIEKFNKDICPICGFKNPLDGATSDTVEITSQINMHNEVSEYKPKKRKVFIGLTFLSFLGINFFYIKRKNIGLLLLLANVLLIGGIFSLIAFAFKGNMFLAFIIPFMLFYIVDVAMSFVLFNLIFNHKDGNGNFLR